MTSEARAEARQSIDRTSSPITYSRSESNSVPGPRTSRAVRPSSSRSRARREGRCLRDGKPGRTRTAHGAATDTCRPASRSGPSERTVTRSERRSPRRTGCSTVVIVVTRPGSRSSACLVISTPAVGAQASRSTPRTRRLPSLCTVNATRASSPSLVVWSPDRVSVRARGEPASQASKPRSRRSTASNARTASHDRAPKATGTVSSSARSAARPVTTMGYADQRGAGTVARMPSRTASGVTPSSSASGRRDTR